MAGVTLNEAEKHLKAWLKAELEITTSQSYRIGGRTLYRADLKQVREQIIYILAKSSNSVKPEGAESYNAGCPA